MDDQCEVCSDVIRQKQQKVTCQNCEKMYHRVCTNLRQDEYRTMYRDKTLDSWHCDGCTSDTGNKGTEILPTGIVNNNTQPVEQQGKDEAIAKVQDTGPTEMEVQTEVSAPNIIQNVCTGNDLLSPVCPPVTTQSVASSSVPSILSASSNSEGVVSPSAVLQGVVVTSAVEQSKTSTEVQSLASTSSGVQGVVYTSTSTGVSRVDSTAACAQVQGGQGIASTGVQHLNPISTSTDVHLQDTVPSHGVIRDNVLSTASQPLQRQNKFTSAVKTAVNGINNIFSKIQEQRLGVREFSSTSIQSHSGQVDKNGSSAEQQPTTKEPLKKTVESGTDVSDSKYSCCSVHGKVKPKTNDTTGKVQFVPTPFMEKVENIVPPRVIVGTTRYIPEEFSFKLTRSQAEKINKSRAKNKKEYQVRLRFCKYNTKSVQEDLIPAGTMRVNNSYVSLAPCIDVDANKKKKKQEPIDITKLLDVNLKNTVKIMHNVKENYYMTCELGRRRSVDELLEMLTVNHPQHTQDLIKEKFAADEDSEIATTNLKASLICPIGKMRLIKPCRSKHCSHIQCIDASTILSLNENKPAWKCQVCQKQAEFDDLYIDGLFLDILASVPWDVVEVEFLKDGSWTHKKAGNQKSDSDKENTCISLDETIDKLDVIDLTETDDECSPARKAPLKTNTSLLNRIVNITKSRFVGPLPQSESHSERLGSAGSTCSESSSRTASSSSTSSIISELSSSHRSTLSTTSSSTSSSNQDDNSSYGCHRNNRHRYRQKGPYQTLSRNYSNSYSAYRNNYSSGNYRQTTLDHYNWRNTNNNWGSYYTSGNNRNTNYYWQSNWRT